MKRLFALAALICSLTASVLGQPPVEYGRGHVPPKQIDHLKKLSLDRFGDTVAKLPKASDPKFDCRDLLGPIKNQGSCGSCWDFAATGCIEGAYAKVGKRFILSEQYTLDCVRSGGCNGDDYSTVYKWAKNNGVPESKDYGGYFANEQRCKWNEGMKLHSILNWGYVDPDNEIALTQKIKDAMKAYGPIGSAVAAGSSWNGYKGGVHRGTNRGINHEVILVGWDDTLVPGKTVWVMRNSWSENWGDKGHMLIEEHSDGIGTEATFVVAEAPPSPPPPPPPAPGPVPGGPNWLWIILICVVIALVLGVVLGRAQRSILRSN